MVSRQHGLEKIFWQPCPTPLRSLKMASKAISQGIPWKKLKKWDFYSILYRQEKAAHSSLGHDILFLSAQRHKLEGPSINFSIWYRVNMDLKNFLTVMSNPSQKLENGFVEGTIQYTGIPIDIQQKMKKCKKIVLIAKNCQNKLGNGFFTLKLT